MYDELDRVMYNLESYLMFGDKHGPDYRTPKLEEFVHGFTYEQLVTQGGGRFEIWDFSKTPVETVESTSIPVEHIWKTLTVPKFEVPSRYEFDGHQVTDYASPLIAKDAYYDGIKLALDKDKIRVKNK